MGPKYWNKDKDTETTGYTDTHVHMYTFFSLVSYIFLS